MEECDSKAALHNSCGRFSRGETGQQEHYFCIVINNTKSYFLINDCIKLATFQTSIHKHGFEADNVRVVEWSVG